MRSAQATCARWPSKSERSRADRLSDAFVRSRTVPSRYSPRGPGGLHGQLGMAVVGPRGLDLDLLQPQPLGESRGVQDAEHVPFPGCRAIGDNAQDQRPQVSPAVRPPVQVFDLAGDGGLLRRHQVPAGQEGGLQVHPPDDDGIDEAVRRGPRGPAAGRRRREARHARGQQPQEARADRRVHPTGPAARHQDPPPLPGPVVWTHHRHRGSNADHPGRFEPQPHNIGSPNPLTIVIVTAPHVKCGGSPALRKRPGSRSRSRMAAGLGHDGRPSADRPVPGPRRARSPGRSRAGKTWVVTQGS